MSREADLVLKAKVRGKPSCLLIHVEHESSSRAHFPRFHENEHWIPIYPIVVYSYRQPRVPGRDHYAIQVADLEVLHFRYRVIQLNQLRWQDYLNHSNPLACALMARMRIETADRPQVKLECLRLLLRLRLDPRKAAFQGLQGCRRNSRYDLASASTFLHSRAVPGA